MTMETGSKRWDYIDLSEFIGMFMVLIYHSTTYSYDFIGENGAILYVHFFLRTILSTCVPLFFFANGYLLFNRKFDLKKHLIKTIMLIVLTVIWGMINILPAIPTEHKAIIMTEVLQSPMTWNQGWINYLWYMGALVCIYIFFPILKSVFDTHKKIFVYFIIACATFTFGNIMLGIAGTILADDLLGLKINLYGENLFDIFNPFQGIHGYSFVYFCLGGLAFDYVEKIRNWNRRKRNIIASSAIAVSCLGLFITGVLLSKIMGEVWDVVWCGYDTVFTCINVCAIFVLTISYSSGNRPINRFIYHVSANTLGIYFVHEIFIHLTIPVVRQWLIAQNFLGCMIYAFIVLTVSLLTVMVIKKIPVLNYLVDTNKIVKKICKE